MYASRILGRKIEVEYSEFRNRFSCGVDGILIAEAPDAKQAVIEIISHITLGHYGRLLHVELPAILWEKIEDLRQR